MAFALAPHLAPHFGLHLAPHFAEHFAPHFDEYAAHLARHFGAQPAARAGASPAARAELTAIFANSDKFFIMTPYFLGAHFAAHLGAHFGAHFDFAAHFEAVAAGAHFALHLGEQAAAIAEKLDIANAEVTAIADKIERFFIFKAP